MRKDIQAINEAFSKVHKEQSDNTDMEATPASPKRFSIQRKNYDQIFYNAWDHIVNELSDEELEATMHMIKNYDELNQLIKDQARYRSNQESGSHESEEYGDEHNYV